MIKNLTSKLVWRPRGQSELYDLESDPKEVNNLYDDPVHAPMQQALQAKLLYWYTQTADVTPENLDPRGLSPFIECKATAAAGVAHSAPVPSGRLGSMSVTRDEAINSLRNAVGAGDADAEKAMGLAGRLRTMPATGRVPLARLLVAIPIEHCPETARALVDPTDVALLRQEVERGTTGVVGNPFTAYC